MGQDCAELWTATNANDESCSVVQTYFCNVGYRGCDERIRRSWSDLNDYERSLYIDGFRELADRGVVQQFARTHAQSALHGTQRFLPWHRGFIYEVK